MLNVTNLFKLCSIEEVSETTPKRVILPNQDAVAICQIDDEYFALDDLCSHGLASLCDGDVEDGQIFCPFHGGAFDIKTGKATERPCTQPVQTYPVYVENGDLFIKLP